ncbi:hypothetical protein CYMTET_3262 [Cymbomonas tetramitiformis]|uniref:3'-5' exonuclease n=1 Tax=Cymbomonas tetramitiformis TaxID=36881 RepID=A0AAE0H3G8_9CHLO|nr:hypothetical protein CYMTET_3262 [Cymbomonas tetramitiformis]|eukprot:gene1195-1765_t
MAANFRSALNQAAQQYNLSQPEWTFTEFAEPQRWQATLRLDPYLPVTSCVCTTKVAAKEDACQQFLQAHSELSQPPQRATGLLPWTCILRGPAAGYIDTVRRQFPPADLEAVLSGPPCIAVDCEGVVTASGIQLAILTLFDGEQVWVLDTQACGESHALLTTLFGDESVVKVFCDYGADERMLSPLFPEIRNTKDIQCMQPDAWESPLRGNRRSLVRIWEMCTGVFGVFYKDKNLTVSAWDSHELSKEQLEYAIADVYATYCCYQVFSHRRITVNFRPLPSLEMKTLNPFIIVVGTCAPERARPTLLYEKEFFVFDDNYACAFSGIDDDDDNLSKLLRRFDVVLNKKG